MNVEGIGRTCAACGERYICTDGDPFCSDKCYDDWEERREAEVSEGEY